MFQNSGAEVTEAAIKCARRYFYSIENQKIEFYVKNFSEEQLLPSMQVALKMIEGFGPKVNGFDHFIFGDHKSFLKKLLKTLLQ